MNDRTHPSDARSHSFMSLGIRVHDALLSQEWLLGYKPSSHEWRVRSQLK